MRRLGVGRFLLAACAVGALALLAAPAASAARFGSRPLKPGMHGHDVSVLQKFLTKLGLRTKRDGAYGKSTTHNVKRLEARQHWKRDGKVDRKQAKKIKRMVRKAPRVASARARYYFFGSQAPTLALSANGPGDVRVDVLGSDNSRVMSLTVSMGGSEGGGVGSSYSGVTTWYGRDLDGKVARDGDYHFAVGDAGGTGARIVGGQTVPFELRSHIFPVRGPHSFGGAGARFGAPRNGHIHQGQDVPAACGTRLAAAQGGSVVARAYQASGAGNYVVIKGKGTKKDYVYMHLKGPGPLSKGDTVRTGQQIGKVGETGDAVGCHLHFERWSKPGWFAGGHPFDPLPSLEYWDSYS